MKPPLPEDGRFTELPAEGFSFACHPGVPCFNQCCRRLILVLTPYDVLRLKRRLGLSSAEFIETYCQMEPWQNGWSMPKLQMRSDEAEHTCPFLGEGGCTVYEDRPGACRTYPLGRAKKGGQSEDAGEESYFLVREDHCRGFEEGRRWSPDEWVADQGLEPYNQFNDLFLPIITRQAPDADPDVIARKMQMFMLACYNPEQFVRFLTATRFSQLFEVEEQRLQRVREDEEELLRLAFEWLRHAIFGDATMKLREGVTAPKPPWEA